MTAGRRDTLISIERAVAVQDPYGEETLTWSQLGTEWAAVFYGRGDERRQAAMEQGTQAATFQLLANAMTRSLTLRDRIVLDEMAWDITGAVPVGRQHVEVTATRSA